MKLLKNITLPLRRRVDVVTTAGQTVALPMTEWLVFAVLNELFKEHGPVHGPFIAQHSDGELSLATVYGSLRRLQEKGVVEPKEEYFEVGPSKVRRVVWRPTARTLSQNLATQKGEISNGNILLSPG